MALYHLLVLFTISTKLAGEAPSAPPSQAAGDAYSPPGSLGVVAECTCADVDNKGKLTCTKDVPEEAVKKCDKLETLILAKGVKTVGKSAFKDCKKLKTLTISPTVEIIGEEAFEDCKLMESVKIEPRIELLEGPPKTNIVCSIKKFGKESFKNAGSNSNTPFTLDLSECDQLTEFGESSFEESNVGMLKLPQRQLMSIPNPPASRRAMCNIESFGEKAFYKATNLVGETCVDDLPFLQGNNMYEQYKTASNQCLDVAFCTSLKKIGKEAFDKTKIKMYVINSEAGVTDSIGKHAFPDNTMKAIRQEMKPPAGGRRLQTDNATEESDTDVVDDESEWDEVYVRLSDVLQQPPTCDDPKDDGLSLGEKIIIGLGAPTLALTLGFGAVAVYMLVNSKQNMGDKNP